MGRLMRINGITPVRTHRHKVTTDSNHKLGYAENLPDSPRFSGFAAYAASKHAVVGLTEALAIEGRADDIRVNAIAPGAFDTAMSRSLGLTPNTKASALVPTIHYLLDRDQSESLSGTTIEILCNDQ